jgi:PPOX class probable F420-dependent enzyme
VNARLVLERLDGVPTAGSLSRRMASRRDQIRMTDDELRDFLAEQKVVTVATTGPNGRPHLMPLWYSVDGDELRGWTYAKSQKAKNLERDPRATLQIEDGVEYQDLRGVMFEADVGVERDPAEVARYGIELFKRFVPTQDGRLPDDVVQMIENQAQKRIGLRFVPTRTVSWDHRKLGGTY